MEQDTTKKESRYRSITIMLLLIGGSIWAIWDIIVAFFNKVAYDTISEIYFGTAFEHPALPFSMGVIMGHLNLPRPEVLGGNPLAAGLSLIITAVIMLAVSITAAKMGHPIRLAPIFPFVVGFVIGHFLWPQTWPYRTGLL